MAKRMTDTRKWADSWFYGLHFKDKILWLFVLDNCDNAGVWDANQKLTENLLGITIDLDKAAMALRRKVKTLPGGKWWIPAFIEFQYGVLRGDSRPHQNVIALLQAHKLWDSYLEYLDHRDLDRVSIPYAYPMPRVLDKDKDKDTGIPVLGENASTATDVPDAPNTEETRRRLKLASSISILDVEHYPYFKDAAFTSTFRRYLEMRDGKKKPATDYAQQLVLRELHQQPLPKALAMLDQSIINSWTGVFPVKEQNHGTSDIRGSGQRRESLTEANQRKARELEQSLRSDEAGDGPDFADVQVVP